MNTRTKLIDMVRGTRSGSWVEVLHGDAGTAYMLHIPYDNGADYRRTPIIPETWEAVCVEVSGRLGDTTAEQLPKFDDGRRYTGDVVDAPEMRALMKWIR